MLVCIYGKYVTLVQGWSNDWERRVTENVKLLTRRFVLCILHTLKPRKRSTLQADGPEKKNT